MIKKPELVDIVLDKALVFTFRVLDHFLKEFGAENLIAFQGDATGSNKLISPQQFERFAFPTVVKVAQRVVDLGVRHPGSPQGARGCEDPRRAQR